MDIKKYIQKSPLWSFFTIALLLNFVFWFLFKTINTGVVNGFAAIAATSPAIAAIIVMSSEEEKVAISKKKRLLVFLIGLIGIETIFFFRRYWVFLNIVHVSGRPTVNAIYPSMIAVFIDLIAAIIIAFTLSKMKFLFDFTAFRNKWHLMLLAIMIYPLTVVIGNSFSLVLGQEVIYLNTTTSIEYLFIDIAIIFLYTLFCGGGMEEPGWRGYLLPNFEKKFNPLMSSLLVSPFWAFWHLPLFLSGDFSGGILGNIFFIFGTIPMSIVLTTAFNVSRGYILIPMLLHTSFNITSTYLSVSPLGSLMWILMSIVSSFLLIKKVNNN